MQFGLSESVAHWGRYCRDREAVITNGGALSYGMLNNTVEPIVARVQNDPARRVAVACGAKFNLLVGILAILRAGKSVVLLNPALTDDAVNTNLGDADVEVLLHDGCFERVQSLVRDRGGRVIVMSQSEERLRVSPAARLPTDEWGVLYSSGTTGTPKGIERDQESMVTEFLGWILARIIHERADSR